MEQTLNTIKEKYGDVGLKFSGYYKYRFGFTGKADDGCDIYVSVGGVADDIYELDVDANSKETINSLSPNYISITKNGKEIFEWRNYW